MSKKIRSGAPWAKSIIVFTIESTDDADELAVKRKDGQWDYPGYTPSYVIQRDIIIELNGKGFKAAVLPELVPIKRIAVLAGIGAYAKNSMIISPKNGLWLRLAGVITDCVLEPDKSFEEDICKDCERCIRACPVNAIEPYVLDSLKCLVHVMEIENPDATKKNLLIRYTPNLTPNTYRMCTVCQMICPFTSIERKRKVLR